MSTSLPFTATLQGLINNYERKSGVASECARRLASAHSDLCAATQELGKFLVPADAKDRESFNVWVGSKLMVVTFHAGTPGTEDYPGVSTSYDIVMRAGGKVEHVV